MCRRADNRRAGAAGFERLVLWPRGVDSRLFRPDRPGGSRCAGAGFAPDDDVVGYVGRIAVEKNVDYLADSLASVAAERPRPASSSSATDRSAARSWGSWDRTPGSWVSKRRGPGRPLRRRRPVRVREPDRDVRQRRPRGAWRRGCRWSRSVPGGWAGPFSPGRRASWLSRRSRLSAWPTPCSR